MSSSTPSGLASTQLLAHATPTHPQPAVHEPHLHALITFFEQLCGKIALHLAQHASSPARIATASHIVAVAARMAREVLQNDRPVAMDLIHQDDWAEHLLLEPRLVAAMSGLVDQGGSSGLQLMQVKKKPRINVALAKSYDHAADSGYSTGGSPPSSPIHMDKRRRRASKKLPAAPRIRVRRIARHAAVDGPNGYVAFRQIKWKTPCILHLDNNHSVFSVFSWNALSPKYCTLRKFPHLQPDYANWECRRTAIMSEVLFYEPDIVCLQEIEADDYAEYFDKVFAAAGYCGLYDKKKHDYIIDGCATFYKRERFELVSHEVLHYNAVDFDTSQHTFRGSPRHYARACRFDLHFNLAQITTLRNRQTHALTRVVNTHLLADPAFADAKLLQAALLVDRLMQLDRRARRRLPNIVCGDLNSVPASAVVQYLLAGKIHKREFWKSDFGRFTSRKHLRHNLSLGSTYSAADVAFTTRSADFTGCVDYILYSDRMIKCIGVLGDLETKGHVWMPNELCPSDHIPMYCVLQQLA